MPVYFTGWYVCAQTLQSCLTLCDTIDCSLLGSSVQGILQGGILEWIAIPSSGENLPDLEVEPISPMSPALQVDSSPTEPPGKNMLRTHCEICLPFAFCFAIKHSSFLAFPKVS